jgi:hypothetical protein
VFESSSHHQIRELGHLEDEQRHGPWESCTHCACFEGTMTSLVSCVRWMIWEMEMPVSVSWMMLGWSASASWGDWFWEILS